jgi:hypothetical protein
LPGSIAIERSSTSNPLRVENRRVFGVAFEAEVLIKVGVEIVHYLIDGNSARNVLTHLTWNDIGAACGMTRQAAYDR